MPGLYLEQEESARFYARLDFFPGLTQMGSHGLPGSFGIAGFDLLQHMKMVLLCSCTSARSGNGQISRILEQIDDGVDHN